MQIEMGIKAKLQEILLNLFSTTASDPTNSNGDAYTPVIYTPTSDGRTEDKEGTSWLCPSEVEINKLS
ncbi:MAG: hypothetical protein LUQ65_05720 [Candidatus Helarchaeota archaeon]|nr:hypothetical protein [Candidatus Helarchaeota archaeon]